MDMCEKEGLGWTVNIQMCWDICDKSNLVASCSFRLNQLCDQFSRAQLLPRQSETDGIGEFLSGNLVNRFCIYGKVRIWLWYSTLVTYLSGPRGWSLNVSLLKGVCTINACWAQNAQKGQLFCPDNVHFVIWAFKLLMTTTIEAAGIKLTFINKKIESISFIYLFMWNSLQKDVFETP